MRFLPLIWIEFVEEGSDGGALGRLLRRGAVMGEMNGREMRTAVRFKKPDFRKLDAKSPRPVSRRGLNCCDDGYMPVICPTCQILKKPAR
jgi:hypothetical protein